MRCLDKLASDFESVQKEIEFVNSSFRMLLESKKQYLEMLAKATRRSEGVPWKAAGALVESLSAEMKLGEVFVTFLQGPMMASLCSLEEEVSKDFSSFKARIKSFEDRDRELKTQMERAAKDSTKDPIVRYYTVQGYLNKRSTHTRKNKELLESCFENGIADINRARDLLRMGIQRFNVHRRKFLENECEVSKHGEIFSDFEEKLNLQSFKNMLDDEMRVRPGAEKPGSVLYKEHIKVRSGLSGWKDCLVVLLGRKLLFVETGGKEKMGLPDLLAEGKPLECSVASVDVARVDTQRVDLVRRHRGFFSALFGLGSFGLKFPSSASLQNFIEALSGDPTGPKVKDENNPWTQ